MQSRIRQILEDQIMMRGDAMDHVGFGGDYFGGAVRKKKSKYATNGAKGLAEWRKQYNMISKQNPNWSAADKRAAASMAYRKKNPSKTASRTTRTKKTLTRKTPTALGKIRNNTYGIEKSLGNCWNKFRRYLHTNNKKAYGDFLHKGYCIPKKSKYKVAKKKVSLKEADLAALRRKYKL